ncbi:MAG: RNA polymerase sigma factor [Planctomycetota bacterium]|jgi:RNA polymerase sigma factor (sigma-70 family)
MMDKGFKAIADLFSRHGEDMVRWARRVLHSETDAEDVVQEVMLGLLRAPHLLVGVDRLGAWLFTLVKRKSVDLIRREVRRRSREAEIGLEEVFEGTDPAAWMMREEFAEAFARAVDGLDEELRSVFVQNGLEDRTFREISGASGVPMGTLMARKKKAVEILREALLREGFLR